MSNKEIIEKIRNLSGKEKRSIPYEELIDIVHRLSSDEIVELSNIIGYPVFTRLCMGDLKHKFVLLQPGAAAVIVNEKGQILLQSRADNDKWGLPGGCQDLGERLEDTVIREIKEETNLDITEDNLHLITVVSGPSRKNEYPNGDVVFNNTALYYVKNYSGELKWDSESKAMKFFDLDNLPSHQHDRDLIDVYIKYLNEKND